MTALLLLKRGKAWLELAENWKFSSRQIEIFHCGDVVMGGKDPGVSVEDSWEQQGEDL